MTKSYPSVGRASDYHKCDCVVSVIIQEPILLCLRRFTDRNSNINLTPFTFFTNCAVLQIIWSKVLMGWSESSEYGPMKLLHFNLTDHIMKSSL